MDEKFPNIETDLEFQLHEAFRSPKSFNPNRSAPRHIMIKLSKTKNKAKI